MFSEYRICSGTRECVGVWGWTEGERGRECVGVWAWTEGERGRERERKKREQKRQRETDRQTDGEDQKKKKLDFVGQDCLWRTSESPLDTYQSTRSRCIHRHTDT